MSDNTDNDDSLPSHTPDAANASAPAEVAAPAAPAAPSAPSAAAPPPAPPAPPTAGPLGGNWERETLEKLVFATVKEQRAARRWGIFFKSLTLGLAFFALWAYFDFNFSSSDMEALGRHTALIEIEGAIEAEGPGSANAVIPSLNKAFSDAGSVAIVLHINSPGGSPVQAGMIVDEILRLRK